MWTPARISSVEGAQFLWPSMPFYHHHHHHHDLIYEAEDKRSSQCCRCMTGRCSHECMDIMRRRFTLLHHQFLLLLLCRGRCIFKILPYKGSFEKMCGSDTLVVPIWSIWLVSRHFRIFRHQDSNPLVGRHATFLMVWGWGKHDC